MSHTVRISGGRIPRSIKRGTGGIRRSRDAIERSGYVDQETHFDVRGVSRATSDRVESNERVIILVEAVFEVVRTVQVVSGGRTSRISGIVSSS